MTDPQRMIWRDDVEGICRTPEMCFEYCEHVRCGPCAIKQATAAGVESDMSVPNLPEVYRLRRQLEDAHKALRSLAEGNLGDQPWQANYDTIRIVARGALPEDQRKP